MSQPQVMRDYEKWAKSLRNYDWLAGVVPGAMDVDVLIERKGHFLVLEAKEWASDGIRVGFGQHLALEALSRLDSFDVYLVGEGKGDTLYLLRYDSGAPIRRGTIPVLWPARRFMRTTKEGLRLLVQEWYREMSDG